jgi:hypothetical protein
MRPMLTPAELRKQAVWLKTLPGAKAQRAAELAELAARAQERADSEFTAEEIAAITGASLEEE